MESRTGRRRRGLLWRASAASLVTVTALGLGAVAADAATDQSAMSYTIPRSASAVGQGRTSDVAKHNGAQEARAAVLAAGGDCTNWSQSDRTLFIAPDSSWYVYEVTVSALCVH
ncbi:hypothetical protein [Nonomuraea aurantiaca]|uniref:hypothetical protein n=1 Tax=Nonomuraea aurantiaca TaxID=2878562 RepID=UPI001CD9EE07|nr:hypothetical protein [Nonomuraea aurantiaca]MCA2221933.1 hypothetical protein [Nonomuraea aurantiaca]